MRGKDDRRPRRSLPKRQAIRRATRSLLLAAIFFAQVSPALFARDLTPTELIEDNLPARRNLENARKPDLLAAICRAVRKRRNLSAAITSTAVAARRNLAGDIVAAVIRCIGRADCDFTGAIASAALAAGGNPLAISDAAMAQMPNCAETIQRATRPKPREESLRKETPPRAVEKEVLTALGAAEENYDPLEELILVCDEGAQRALRASLVEEFLRAHPAAQRGACPQSSATPAVARALPVTTPAGAPTPKPATR